LASSNATPRLRSVSTSSVHTGPDRTAHRVG
jgi:hypothetical protein